MDYTIIFVFTQDMEDVLLQRKNRGLYNGRLNGVGGKIDSTDNSAYEGAVRELAEETGLVYPYIEPLRYMLTEYTIQGHTLHIYYTKVVDIENNPPRQIEDEILDWYSVAELYDVRNKDLAGDGNLPYYINLAVHIEQEDLQ